MSEIRLGNVRIGIHAEYCRAAVSGDAARHRNGIVL